MSVIRDGSLGQVTVVSADRELQWRRRIIIVGSEARDEMSSTVFSSAMLADYSRARKSISEEDMSLVSKRPAELGAAMESRPKSR